MRKTEREKQIDRLRALQKDPFSRGFEDRFDRHFDRHFDNMEKMMDNPVKTFAKFGLVAVVINLVFALIVIAAIIFGLSLVF